MDDNHIKMIKRGNIATVVSAGATVAILIAGYNQDWIMAVTGVFLGFITFWYAPAPER